MNITTFKIKRGETAEELYDQCHKRLFYAAYRILNDSMDAEEVMHDVLLKYIDKNINLPTKRERDNWLTRVCINLAIDRLRKKRICDFVDLEKAGLVQEDETDYDEQDHSIEKIKDAMCKLPDGYRVILSLLLFEGYDYEEVAQILRIKEVSVRSQYLRGKIKLKEML